jgi:hypothetical protein
MGRRYKRGTFFDARCSDATVTLDLPVTVWRPLSGLLMPQFSGGIGARERWPRPGW